jgi:hypothetical protein
MAIDTNTQVSAHCSPRRETVLGVLVMTTFRASSALHHVRTAAEAIELVGYLRGSQVLVVTAMAVSTLPSLIEDVMDA